MMIRLGLVGIGKIARDQHLPAIRADDRYELVATASRHAQLDGVPGHADIAAMIAGDHRLDAVSICSPTVGRHANAAAAITQGLHVLLEHPPAATMTDNCTLAANARASRGIGRGS